MQTASIVSILTITEVAMMATHVQPIVAGITDAVMIGMIGRAGVRNMSGAMTVTNARLTGVVIQSVSVSIR